MPVVGVFWTEPGSADFKDAAQPGARVYDSQGRPARVVYGVAATWAGTIAEFRDLLYQTQLLIWNKTSYPVLTVTSGPETGRTFAVIDMIYLTENKAWFGYSVDFAFPQRGPSGTFTCNTFPDATFTTVSGIIDDDNEKSARNNVSGVVRKNSSTRNITIGPLAP